MVSKKTNIFFHIINLNANWNDLEIKNEVEREI